MMKALKQPLFWLGTVCIVVAVLLPVVGYTKHEHSTIAKKVEAYLNKPSAWKLRGMVSGKEYEAYMAETDLESEKEIAKDREVLFYLGSNEFDEEKGIGYVKFMAEVIRHNGSGEPSINFENGKLYYEKINGRERWIPDYDGE